MLDPSRPTRSPLNERGNDLYETPPEAVEALLRTEKLPRNIWEPACGPGSIVSILRERGHYVTATDLVDYGAGLSGIDFLMETSRPAGIEAIVTNPPYGLADQFVRHAIGLCPLVIMLLRLSFLEGTRRSDILDSGHLARVHVFRNRLPMMHRAGYFGPRTTSSGMAFAWFVFDKNHSGPPELHRISWK